MPGDFRQHGARFLMGSRVGRHIDFLIGALAYRDNVEFLISHGLLSSFGVSISYFQYIDRPPKKLSLVPKRRIKTVWAYW